MDRFLSKPTQKRPDTPMKQTKVCLQTWHAAVKAKSSSQSTPPLACTPMQARDASEQDGADGKDSPFKIMRGLEGSAKEQLKRLGLLEKDLRDALFHPGVNGPVPERC